MNKLARFAALALVSSIALATRVVATPADEITRAAVVAGGSVSSEAFVSAFGSVLARAKSRQVGDYVRAAILLRPDLQNEILNTALAVRASSNPRVRQTEVTAIVRAAVRAANGNVTDMILSAINAHPGERNIIALAASSAAPRTDAAVQMVLAHSGFSHDTATAFDTAQGAHHGKHGGGDDDGGDEVRSPEKPPRDS